jgi:hypothetical protein
MQAGYVTGVRLWACLLGLCMMLPLVGCPSVYWTNPTKPSTAFADDAATCEVEAAQAPTTSNVFDADHYDAYLACLRGQGWELQQRP